MTSFLEVSPGVKSMSRLTIAVLLALSAVVVAIFGFYVIWLATHSFKIDAAVVTAFGAVLGALGIPKAIAIWTRDGKEEPDANTSA